MNDLPIAETKKSLSPFVIVAVLGLLGALIFIAILIKDRILQQTSGAPSVEEIASPPPGSVLKEFTVDGSSFEFDPKTITVKKGDTVKITFKDIDGRHNLVIDGYDLSTDIIGKGKEDTIQFVADKAGSFEYYCSVANHEELGMTGTLVVEEVDVKPSLEV